MRYIMKFENVKINSLGQVISSLENFWNWFGGSKIVDKDGRPLVVYHGTSKDFDIFNMGKISDEEFDHLYTANIRSGADPTAFLGSHFADNVETANMFTKKIYSHDGSSGNVVPVYLKIENMLELSEKELQHNIKKQSMLGFNAVDREFEYSEEFHDMTEDEFEKKYRTDLNFRIYIHDNILGEDHSDAISFAMSLAEEYRKTLDKNIDGIKYTNDVEGGVSYIVFNPNQIKSAIGNNGNYSNRDSIIEKFSTYCSR